MTTELNKPLLLTELQEWEGLRRAYQSHKRTTTAQTVLLESEGFTLDLSNQPYSSGIHQAAETLFTKRQFTAWRQRLYNGDIVNFSEQRAAWHTALRSEIPPDEVSHERQHLEHWVQNIDSQFKHIIHIGIGGSDWGPRLFIRALAHQPQHRSISFVSNIDGHAIDAALKTASPHETLIIVSSKSFSTTETMLNAQRAFEWLKNAGLLISRHVVAITANPKKAQDCGIDPHNIFKFWDWVGGRYSVWSSIALPVALCLGIDVYKDMLRGAASMDKHFYTRPLTHNIPIQMALIGLVHRNLNHYPSLNIAAYDSRLDYLAPYLQQLEMESLGKSVSISGKHLNYHTGPIIWGMTGTDAQHTFFQWLHQGAEGAPVDFIVCLHPDHQHTEHHKLLFANCLAQRQTLKQGKPLNHSNNSSSDTTLATQQEQTGGRPSSLFVLKRLNAFSLASLIAAYEHKVFTQAVLWGINPFDQWGVEEGKLIAQNILQSLSEPTVHDSIDTSTAYWIKTLQTSF